MINQANDQPDRIPRFRKINGHGWAPPNSEIVKQEVTKQIFNVINSQNELIVKLLKRQIELTQKLEKISPNSSLSSGSQNKASLRPTKYYGYRELTEQEINGKDLPHEINKETTKHKFKVISTLLSNKCPTQKIKSEVCSKSIDNEGQQVSDVKRLKPSFRKKQTQTKNMVKNFAKAIFSFIYKNRQKRLKVLSYLGIDDVDFMQIFKSLKGHIHSISELRNLWTPEGNIYHKAFRIMSCEYLRKYCLQRTYNSRVKDENHLVHLKYRQRLIDSLKQPEGFTVLKTD